MDGSLSALQASGAWRRRIARILNIDPQELGPVALGMSLFLLLFAGYFMLRPVRETMGLAGGVQNLQWLFTGTFVATLAAMPLFGWLAGRAARRRLLSWTLGFFASNLLLFAGAFALDPDNAWIARGFYIWLSVFSLLAMSVAWSVLADLFNAEQAKRLFALMAAGASLGGLLGPVLGVLLVGSIGHAGLMLLSALMLIGAACVGVRLQRWRDTQVVSAAQMQTRNKPIGGSPWAGAQLVLRSPFLLGCGVFVLLLASTTTFLYFEQARLVEATFTSRTEQTQVFGLIDIVVQSLAILTQLFFTGRIAQRLGVLSLLVAVPVLISGGFLLLALSPSFAVLAVIMVLRRAGEYALVRPGREMLFTVVSNEEKYKAKNFIDTVVYRGADAASAWLKTLIDLMAQQPAAVAVMGAGIALAWAATGVSLAKAQQRILGQTRGDNAASPEMQGCATERS